MVAVRGKSSTFLNRVENHGINNSVGAKSFKIYTENDTVKVHHRRPIKAQPNGTSRESLVAPGRKSCSSNKQTGQTNANDSKVVSKTLLKIKAQGTGRKVLADVSNLRSSFMRAEVRVGSKLIRKSCSSNKPTAQTNASDSKVVPKTLLKNKAQGTGRNVLVDVSNLRSSFMRPEVRDGSKLMVSTDLGTRNANASSRTHVVGKARQNKKQVVAGCPTLNRGAKGLKAYDLRSKGQGLGSINSNNRESARNPLPPTRKSLPALKCVKHTDTTDRKKETDKNFGKGSGSYGFFVKPKVSRKVLPRDRVGNGFVIKPSESQAKVATQVFSRKSVKPNLKTVPSTTQSKWASTGKKTNLLAAISRRRMDKTASASSTKNCVLIAPPEQRAQRCVSSDCNSNTCTDVSDSDCRRKPNRRKSFTSLLMARSKVLQEHTDFVKQESLPRIYDVGNHLEVAEYVDEIYHYYWIMEAQNPSLENYMTRQTGTTRHMRGILINWLIEVHLKFDLMQETLYLTVTLLDRYLSLVTIKTNEMQLVGLTALLLASKYEDFWHPRVLDLISISAESYTKDQMLGMERDMLKNLKFRLNAPTLYVFMLKFLRAAQSNTKLEHLAFYLIELCLVQYDALKFKPSLLCASAIYVAQCTLQKTPSWTPLLCNHARYEESQMRDCAEKVLEFHKAAKTSMLKVSFEKYTRPDFGGVANIRPLSRLPRVS